MANQRPVQAVISLHGIRTSGPWQKKLAPELALAGFIPYALDYGYLRALKLLYPPTLNKQVEWLMEEYDRIRADSGCAQPSIIAHSFGTLQVAHLLQKHSEVTFDTVILAASIVPTDFRWADLLEENRVRWVMNDYGGKDWWPKVARYCVPNGGSSGSNGFTGHHHFLHQVKNRLHRHSDYFTHAHFRYNWLPTLLVNKRQVIEDLQHMMRALETAYRVRASSLRCLVFAEQLPRSGCLKAVDGLHVGEFVPAEHNLVVELDKLGPSAAPVVAFRSNRESRLHADDIGILKKEARDRVHPQLAWSVAMPVSVGEDGEQPVGALILDCLDGSFKFLPDQLSEDETVFNVLRRLGKTLDRLSILR